jgi:hypothetical protein
MSCGASTASSPYDVEDRTMIVPPSVDEVEVLIGAALRAPDGRSLGRLGSLGLDHFGHLSALVGHGGEHSAAAIREVSHDGEVVVVDPAQPLRQVVYRYVGGDTPSWTTDDMELRVCGLRLERATHRMTSLLVRRHHSRDLPWGMVFPDAEGVPLAAYWDRESDMPRTF